LQYLKRDRELEDFYNEVSQNELESRKLQALDEDEED